MEFLEYFANWKMAASAFVLFIAIVLIWFWRGFGFGNSKAKDNHSFEEGMIFCLVFAFVYALLKLFVFVVASVLVQLL